MKFLAILILLVIVLVVVLVIRSRKNRKARVVAPKNDWQGTSNTYGGTTYQSAVSKPAQPHTTLPSSSSYSRPTTKPAPKAKKYDRDEDEDFAAGGYAVDIPSGSYYTEPAVDVNEPSKVDTSYSEPERSTYSAPTYEAPSYTPPSSSSSSDSTSYSSPDTSSY